MYNNGGADGEKWINLRDRRWCELVVVVLDVVWDRDGGVKGHAPGSDLGCWEVLCSEQTGGGGMTFLSLCLHATYCIVLEFTLLKFLVKLTKIEKSRKG